MAVLYELLGVPPSPNLHNQIPIRQNPMYCRTSCALWLCALVCISLCAGVLFLFLSVLSRSFVRWCRHLDWDYLLLMSRLRSRRHFVAEAERLASLNQTEQETWEQSWIEGVPPGHDVVTNPTCPVTTTWVHSTEKSVRHSKSSAMCPGQMCRISLPMVRDRITCLPLRREPPDHKTHCWRVPTRSGSRRGGMVVETVYETVRVFQTNNNNINFVELSTSKFHPFIKLLIFTICAQRLWQTRETCCKEGEHLKTNTKKTIKVEFK